ncbi:helix-turn-helix domain-containing protein [Sphingomonas sp. 10B4]|uniref:helix-turn-helix domain-containing protein n=1 Tax=Sphingomonas sp. 10B4 TaxID=3048575 RepID=UPI003A0FF440
MNTTNIELPKLAYSVREACAASSLGRTKLWALINDGHLKVTRIGGRTIIPVESLHALVTGEPMPAETLPSSVTGEV